MILYEKKFRLGNGVSFSRYIKSLDEMNFSPYTLLINQIFDTKDFHIEVSITNPINLWGWHNIFLGGVLFSKLTVKHSKSESSFLLQGGIKTGNLLIAILCTALSLLGFLFFLFSMLAKGDFSLGNFLIFSLIGLLIVTPVISTYLRDKKLLDRIGTIASEIKRK